jgi:hypothetical protein
MENNAVNKIQPGHSLYGIMLEKIIKYRLSLCNLDSLGCALYRQRNLHG